MPFKSTSRKASVSAAAVWEKVALSPSFALDAANLVVLLKVDD
jgi:hypothetical protein